MKRLYKSRKNKVIDGVCGGIAEYLEVDPVLVRLVAVLFIFLGGASIIAYIIAMIVIPYEPRAETQGGTNVPGQNAVPPIPNDRKGNSIGSLIIGILLIAFGVHFLLTRIPLFNIYYSRFWHLGWHFFWPAVLILVGLLIVLKGFRK